MEESFTEGIYDTDIYFLTEILEESISYTMRSENSFYYDDEKPKRPHFIYFNPQLAFDRIWSRLNKYDNQKQLSLYKNLFNLIEDKQVDYLSEIDLNLIPKSFKGKITVNMIIEKMGSLRGHIKNYINKLINEINSHTEPQATVSEDEKAAESFYQKEQSQIEKEKSLQTTNPNAKLTNISAEKEENIIGNISVNLVNEKTGKSSIIEKPEKFYWLKSTLALESLFEDLYNERYVNEYYEEILHQHFEVTSSPEYSNSKNKINSGQFIKINWLKHLTELVYLIYYLDKEGIIQISDENCHIFTMSHFLWKGKDITNYPSLKQTKNNVLYPKKGERDKPKYRPLVKMINRNKNL